MSNDVAKPVRQEILPPVEQGIVSYPEVERLPQGFLGMSFFARARYASEAKQIAAYRELVEAKNALLRALSEQQSLIASYAFQSGRAANLDDIRAAGRASARAEMTAILRQEATNQLAHEVEVERLQFERDRWKKAREALNAKPEARPTSSTADQIRETGEEIDKILREFDEWRSREIEKVGGEDRLSEHAKILMRQFELVRDQKIQAVMEKLI